MRLEADDSMKPLFNDSEKDQIRSAVAEAEKMTAGEIVPYIVNRSGEYAIAYWRGALFGAMTFLVIALFIFQFYTGWGLGWLYQGWGTALFTVIGGLVGALLCMIPSIRRILAGPLEMAMRVHHRAVSAFIDEEVFLTKDRTGILLFVSLFEHRVEVLGDEGINRKVGSDDWIHVIDAVRNGIKNDSLAGGMVDAIGLCGDLLERKGVEMGDPLKNELPDVLRIREN